MKQTLAHGRLLHFFRQRNMLVAICAVLLLIVLIQSVALFMKDERIVVVPPDFRHGFWVTGRDVSASYLEEMALFLSGMQLTVSPASAAYQRDVILRYASPSHYGALKATLLEVEKMLIKQNVSTTFRPLKALPCSEDLTVDLTGDLMTWVGSKRISNVRETYRLAFILERGQLQLLSLQNLKQEAR